MKPINIELKADLVLWLALAAIILVAAFFFSVVAWILGAIAAIGVIMWASGVLDISAKARRYK